MMGNALIPKWAVEALREASGKLNDVERRQFRRHLRILLVMLGYIEENNEDMPPLWRR